MTSPWAPANGPARTRGAGELVTLIDGSTFCISEDDGRVVPGHPHGLFVRDTRCISRWELRIDGQAVERLAVQRTEPFAATFIGRVPPLPGHADSQLLVLERRYVGDGMRSDIAIRNLGRGWARCTMALTVDVDFADLFEVKDGRVGEYSWVVLARTADGLEFSGLRDGRTHGLRLVTGGEKSVVENTLTWEASIPPRRSWSVSVEAQVSENDVPLVPRHPRGSPPEHAAPALGLREWRSRVPEVRASDPNLVAVLARGVEDLGALRMFDPRNPDRAVIAAGMPWFMALFGRDSLLTSWMLLPLDAGLALGTLRTLAEHQGSRVDPVTEEEPGKILHEMRFGPATVLALGGRGAYYGSVDATPLFVMLLGELGRWGADRGEIERLLPHADRALEWIEQYGDADGDGLVEYQRAAKSGLVNQGWKDSWDGVTFADGTIAQAPIALAEAQGYAYAAYLARAHLARETGDADAVIHWLGRARHLKRVFNERFWLPDRGWYALGLDREKKPIDALTSNIGHCLWTGIVDADKARLVADRLLSDEMFSGWGIRTLAASMGAYNPMSYHNGSVWPHDNAICAAGLMRYGFVQGAQRVAEAVLDAAAHFDHRLPELYCGFPRDEFAAPVPYPTSCSPQAWAAATPLLLLRTLLRFEPQLASRRIWCAPAFPRRYLPLKLNGLALGHGAVDIDVRGTGTRLHGLRQAGLRWVRGPRPVEGELR